MKWLMAERLCCFFPVKGRLISLKDHTLQPFPPPLSTQPQQPHLNTPTDFYLFIYTHNNLAHWHHAYPRVLLEPPTPPQNHLCHHIGWEGNSPSCFLYSIKSRSLHPVHRWSEFPATSLEGFLPISPKQWHLTSMLDAPVILFTFSLSSDFSQAWEMRLHYTSNAAWGGEKNVKGSNTGICFGHLTWAFARNRLLTLSNHPAVWVGMRTNLRYCWKERILSFFLV